MPEQFLYEALDAGAMPRAAGCLVIGKVHRARAADGGDTLA
jgi:hypothetical protein